MEPSILPEFVVLSRPLEQLSLQMQQKVDNLISQQTPSRLMAWQSFRAHFIGMLLQDATGCRLSYIPFYFQIQFKTNVDVALVYSTDRLISTLSLPASLSV